MSTPQWEPLPSVKPIETDLMHIETPPVPHDEQKDYLGDGVYASLDASNMIRLTTENGIETTNEIFLEPEVYRALERYTVRIGWRCS